MGSLAPGTAAMQRGPDLACFRGGKLAVGLKLLSQEHAHLGHASFMTLQHGMPVEPVESARQNTLISEDSDIWLVVW